MCLYICLTIHPFVYPSVIWNLFSLMFRTPSSKFNVFDFCCKVTAVQILNTFVLLRKRFFSPVPVGNYMFKVNNRNTRTRCEIGSKLTIKTPERYHWRRSGVFVVNFEHISHLVLVLLLLT